MNKNYIKLFLVIITVLLSFYTFLSTRYEYSTVSSISILLSLVFSLPIIMHSKYNDLKKINYKKVYLIIMLILYFISFTIILCLLIDIIKYQNNLFIIFDTLKVIFSNLLFMTTSWLMLFFSFISLEKETSKENYYINIIVLFIVILIHLNYYNNPNLKTLINELTVGEKAPYITQNYIYFGVMYVLVLISNFTRKD